MELETAVRRMLLQDDTVAGYVGSKVFKHALETIVDRTGGRAVVVKRAGGWAIPQPVNTQEYPLLQIECWADCDRDENGDVTTRNAIDKAFALYRAIDPLVHAKRGVTWGAGGSSDGLCVVSAQRWSEPVPVESKDGHSTAVSGNGMNDLPPQGESAVVWVRYALVVAH